MSALSDDLRIELSTFLHLYPLRARRIMWLLGAGASVSAGLPTAYTLTWEFKRQLYCTAHKLPPTSFPELTDRAFQTRVQSYFDSQSGFPKRDDFEEYSFYFDRYLPDESDRRRLLDARLSGTKPSYGHFCLAALMGLGHIEIVWTTNFDQLVERSATQNVIAEHIPRGLAVVGLECPDKVVDVIRDERWPLIVKLHGDYLYRKLKNTAPELQQQAATFRDRLRDQCGQRGLAVVGYSGRDESVMSALVDSLANNDPFPHGLFWFIRPGDSLAPQVQDLLTKAKTKGCQAGAIEIGSFDELMADLFLPHQDSMPSVRDLVKAQRERRRPFPLAYTGKPWPVLRTNALEITTFPSTCTMFQADIAGAKHVKQVVANHKTRVIAGRRKIGIVAFGTRADLSAAFAAANPRDFLPQPIETRRLRYLDSLELGLFYDAVCGAIAHQTGLHRSQNHKGRILFIPSNDILTAEDKRVFGVFGKAPVRQLRDSLLTFHEAFRVSLEFRDERLWFLLEPTIMITTDGTTPYTGEDRSQLAREDLVRRYNRQANFILAAWITFLSSRCGAPIRLEFPSPKEPEAVFQIGTTTGFARQTC